MLSLYPRYIIISGHEKHIIASSWKWSKMGYILTNGGEICEYRDCVLIKFCVGFFFLLFSLLIPCSFPPRCYYSGAVVCVFASLFGALGSLTTTRQTFSFERMRVLTTSEHALFPTLFHFFMSLGSWQPVFGCVCEYFKVLQRAGINFNSGMVFALFHSCLSNWWHEFDAIRPIKARISSLLYVLFPSTEYYRQQRDTKCFWYFIYRMLNHKNSKNVLVFCFSVHCFAWIISVQSFTHFSTVWSSFR